LCLFLVFFFFCFVFLFFRFEEEAFVRRINIYTATATFPVLEFVAL